MINIVCEEEDLVWFSLLDNNSIAMGKGGIFIEAFVERFAHDHLPLREDLQQNCRDGLPWGWPPLVSRPETLEAVCR